MIRSSKLALLAFAASAACGLTTFANAQTTVLRGARVIDGSGGAPLDSATIVIQDGRIATIGPSASVPTPAGAEVVDYSGKTIMPGLISNHSHVGVFDGTKGAPENYNRAFILKQLKQYEAYGVTSVTSLGLNPPLFYELRAELHAGSVPGADLFGADRGVGVVDGAPPAAVVPLADNQIFRPTDAESGRQAVRDMAARKADLVKIWLDDFGKLLPAKVKPEVYAAVIDEAHKHGLRVAAHVYDLEDAKAIVRAGVDIIAHGVRDQAVDAELIDMLKARQTWYVATIVLDDSNFVFADQPAWMAEPFFQRGLHPSHKALFEDAAWRERTQKAAGSAKGRGAVATNQKNLKALYDAGVQIGFGSDSGVGLRIPGLAEHRELTLMVEGGFTPMQAISIATSKAAMLLKLDDRGTLAAGKLADLVVLDADPTADIANTRKIHAVWHRGKKAAGAIDTFAP